VVSVPTRVVVASGNVATRLTVGALVIVVVVPVEPPASNFIFFVASTESTIDVVVSTKDLLVRV